MPVYRHLWPIPVDFSPKLSLCIFDLLSGSGKTSHRLARRRLWDLRVVVVVVVVAVGSDQALLHILEQAPTPLAGSQLAVSSSRPLPYRGSPVSSRGAPDARSRMGRVLSLGPRWDVALDARLPESGCEALLAGSERAHLSITACQ
jgi:hypothetical protein